MNDKRVNNLQKLLLISVIGAILISSIFTWLLFDYNWQISLHENTPYPVDNLPMFFRFITVMVFVVFPQSLLVGFITAYWINNGLNYKTIGLYNILFINFIYSASAGFFMGIIIWLIYSLLSQIMKVNSDVLFMLPVNIIITFFSTLLFFIPVSCFFSLMALLGGLVYTLIYVSYNTFKNRYS